MLMRLRITIPAILATMLLLTGPAWAQDDIDLDLDEDIGDVDEGTKKEKPAKSDDDDLDIGEEEKPAEDEAKADDEEDPEEGDEDVEEGDEEEGEKKEEKPEQPDENPGIYAPTIAGPTGLIRLVTTDIGSTHTFRVGLHTEMFSSAGFLVKDDDNSRFRGTLSISYTPWKYLELFTNISSMANNNERKRKTEDLDQPLILALGDWTIGAKGQYPIKPWLGLGGQFALTFLNSVGGVSLDSDSTSFYIGLISSMSFLKMTGNVPIRFHFNMGYQVDNSNNLANFKGYTLASLQVEKFALGINQDRMMFKLGLDFPLRKWTKIGVTPILEFNADVATGDADEDFDKAEFKKPQGSLTDADIEGRSTIWMTIGARVNPIRGFNVELASDIGLASPGYGFGPPVVPWNIILGFSYAYDPKPQVKIIKEKGEVRTVVKEVFPKVGKLRGRVINSKTLQPIEGAIVTFPGKDLTSLFTDPDGSFLTYELAPGNHPIMIRKEGFLVGKVMATIKLGGVVNLDVKLTPDPPKVGTVAGKVVDLKGAPVSCKVLLVGTETKSVPTSGTGEFSTKLKPGSYSVEFKSGRFLRKRRIVRVIAGEVARIGIALSPKGWRPVVRVTSGGITVKGKIQFAGKTATLLPASRPVMDYLVHALLENPKVTKIEIGGHTDNRGKLSQNMAISQARASAVRAYLVQNGISSARLIAKGYGPRRPKRPNITARNRRMNNRIEFVVLEAQ